MSQIDKLKQAFRDCHGTFPYREFERLIRAIGFEPLKAGKTGGARRKFMHRVTGKQIWLHEPHDGEMRRLMVRDQQQYLRELGLL